MIFDILSNPFFFISSAVILVGTGLAWYLMKRSGRAPRSNRIQPVAPPSVTFQDVGGLDHALDELREVKEFLADPARFRALGAELPKGILLHGPPGCGKTLLAKAVAGEAGVPFFFVSAAGFVEKFVGLGAARVRDLFEEAKAQAPCIVFIDELDAVGRKRNAEVAGEREFDHTLNQLLIELDGFSGSSGVLLLGATNRPELIDPALLRPGRFDRRIAIDPPDRAGREAVLRLHAARRPFTPSTDWREVAQRTAGLTAAELANVVNEASLLAARRHVSWIGSDDVEEALARMLSGARSIKIMTSDEKLLSAVHEAGHTLLSMLLRDIDPPGRVSILSRTSAFSSSSWSRSDHKDIRTKRELMARLMVLLGGRAAELNTFGEPSTRAEDDLQHAANLARSMVERWAMTGRFDLATRDPSHEAHRISASEVRRLLKQAEQAGRTILADRKTHLIAIAEALVEKESLTSTDLRALTQGRREDAPELAIGG